MFLFVGGPVGTHNDVGHEAEDEECDVSTTAPAGIDDLQDSVRRGRLPLDLDGQQSKQHNLDGGSGCIPACMMAQGDHRRVQEMQIMAQILSAFV